MHFLTLVFPFVLLPSIVLATDAVHIPLMQRGSQDIDLNEEASRIRTKYGFSDSVSAIVQTGQKGKSSSTKVTTPQGVVFCPIAIGTPPQNFSMVLDTGSSDLFVQDSTCNNCDRQTPRYRSSKSKTFRTGSSKEVQLNRGTGKVRGSVSQDTVSLGSFSIKNQNFLDVDSVSNDQLDEDISGVMGLAFNVTASTGTKPFWKTLASNGQLASPQFSLWIERANKTNSTNSKSQPIPGGLLTLGGTNTSLFSGKIEFHNIPAPRTFWSLPVSNLTVNGAPVKFATGKSALAAFETDTSLIGAPSAVVAAIKTALGGRNSPNNPGFFNFPCSKKHEISIAFGGQLWPISPGDLVMSMEPKDTTACIAAIFDISKGPSLLNTNSKSKNTPDWVMGVRFLRNVYSVFRESPPAVGFAVLSTKAGGTGVPSSSTGKNAKPQAPAATPQTPPDLVSPSTNAPSNQTTSSEAPHSGTVALSATHGHLVLTLLFGLLSACFL